jgi:ArsR family transcriptional regulator
MAPNARSGAIERTADADLEWQAYELQASICKVLADPKRIHILHLLADGERSVGELADLLGVRQANASQHLTLMRERGIVVTRRDGRTIYYRLANPTILQACSIMHQVLLEQLAEHEDLSRRLKDWRAAAV